ncbi:MAG TPA: QueT transporter family protein [Ruminococcaceae bacterium]|nr:QueT transporter family protein [Oscillospiraceae bacterium]
MNPKTLFLTRAAVIAALYAALTYAASFVGLAYGNIQFRFSEALTVLACFAPAAIPGLTVGCFIGNLGSPVVMDWVLGTLATLLAALASYWTRSLGGKLSLLWAPLFSTLFNAAFVGLEIAVFTPNGGGLAGFWVLALQVGAGELAVCCLLGIPLRLLIDRNAGLKKVLTTNRGRIK